MTHHPRNLDFCYATERLAALGWVESGELLEYRNPGTEPLGHRVTGSQLRIGGADLSFLSGSAS